MCITNNYFDFQKLHLVNKLDVPAVLVCVVLVCVGSLS